jgi:hypothetical protein
MPGDGFEPWVPEKESLNSNILKDDAANSELVQRWVSMGFPLDNAINFRSELINEIWEFDNPNMMSKYFIRDVLDKMAKEDRYILEPDGYASAEYVNKLSDKGDVNELSGKGYGIFVTDENGGRWPTSPNAYDKANFRNMIEEYRRTIIEDSYKPKEEKSYSLPQTHLFETDYNKFYPPPLPQTNLITDSVKYLPPRPYGGKRKSKRHKKTKRRRNTRKRTSSTKIRRRR